MDAALPRVREIVPACVLAGMGMIFAGTYLDKVKSTDVEQFDPQLLAIVPPLIGLKGNLEVTLSSRLATLANIKSDFQRQAFRMFFSTLAYIMIQGVSASLVISSLCVVMYSPMEYKFHTLLHLTTVSLLTCAFAISTLSVLVFGLIMGCAYIGTDPDNVAPPMAAAFGDLGTVTLLLWTNRYSSAFPEGALMLAFLILLGVFSVGPIFLRCDKELNAPELRGLSINRNTLVGSVMPLLGAVIMSSLSGQVLAHFDRQLKNLARLQIAINGVGGCFGSIVVSRMITRIHAVRKHPHSPPSSPKSLNEPEQRSTERVSNEYQTVCSISSENLSPLCNTGTCACRNCAVTEPEPGTVSVHRQTELDVQVDAARVSRLILFCCLPIHLFLAAFSFILHGVLHPEGDDSSSTLLSSSVAAYLIAGFFQVFIVLNFAKWIVLLCWRHLTNPKPGCSCLCVSPSSDSNPSLASLDLIAIALTTALGDLLGSILLSTSMYCFQSAPL